MSKSALVLAVAAVLASSPQAKAADIGPGVNATTIRLGNTAPYSGPASAYGTIAKSAIAYFDMINQQGGIHGRKVEIVSLDDAFTPPKAIEQTRKLVEGEDVLAIFMPIGTPTSSATQTYLNGKKVPQLFISSGASRWNQPQKYPWTVGWNVDYPTEGRIYAKYVINNVKDPKIAILYQNDDYGKDILAGLKEGLGDKVGLLVDSASYELTDPTITSQIAKLKASGANVFISATTPKFAAQSIQQVDSLAWKPLFILPSVSSSIDPVLSGAGLDKSVGIISCSYTKQPSDPQWRDSPDFQAWNTFMDKYYRAGSKNDYLNAYAYGIAFAMHKALEKAGPNLNRETLMAAVESIRDLDIPMLLPGVKMSVSKDDHGPLKAMQMMRFNGKSWDMIGDLIVGR